ncbi:DinB family protein [Winogradskyella ouciana]|uniref:DinB family protein n=1 Tax=Winogradskyella ouciana TaxID=2608631 RepID=A0A7K1GE69_9FLAO|nr:DinB family protein [Winogradskyella ouciana]MTE26149.1 DinB family protein [Winogradskyella ouciana]
MKYSIEKALEILEQTPKTLKSYLGNLSDDWLFANEGNDTWSPYDVVGHLIHGEKTDWIPRLKIILSNSENKTFESFDRFAQFENSKGKTITQLLNEFENLRQDNLKVLKQLNLSSEQLKLKSMHPELGEVSISELLACWVTHDLGHIAQISRVMAKQYKNEVGPWVAYIPILNT